MRTNLKAIQNFYFLGIGGIGMSALARYFHVMKKTVSGYDRTLTVLTRQMEKEGIPITYQDSPDTLPIWLEPKNSLIIYTPALPKDHQQWQILRAQSYPIKKRSEVLGLITRDSFCLAVAGTHGKTTICTLLGHLLHSAGKKSTAFLGGIAENYQSNIILGGEEISVVEADEFDRSFLQLSPDIACITSVDADHLDIYQNKNALEDSYQIFSQQLKPQGKLFVYKGLPISGGISYAIGEQADYYSDHLRMESNGWCFDFHSPDETWEALPLRLPGQHNLENATAALSMAMQMQVTAEEARVALTSFRGIRRRFSIQHRSGEKIYIDDYAHHPTEIDALISTTRAWAPGKKILGVFQPHLFSRTRDFQEAFARSLEKLDALILLEIYPAREAPIEVITTLALFKQIQLEEKEVAKLSNALERIRTKDFEVLLTIGAGDIDTLAEPIKKWLDEQYG
ncbi:MAG: UDP-N-acetylmuramate--L-alanine ligase [Flavobacteriales bacterium AspAUS03]